MSEHNRRYPKQAIICFLVIALLGPWLAVLGLGSAGGIKVFFGILVLPFYILADYIFEFSSKNPLALVGLAYVFGGPYAVAVGLVTGSYVFLRGTVTLWRMCMITVILTPLLTAAFFFQSSTQFGFAFGEILSVSLIMAFFGLMATVGCWIILALSGVLRGYSLKKFRALLLDKEL